MFNQRKLVWINYLDWSRLLTGIFEVNLDRPEAKNAIGKDMLKGLQQAFEAVSREHSANVLMICSSVSKVFCAGADLKVVVNFFKMQLSSLITKQELWPKWLFRFSAWKVGFFYYTSNILTVLFSRWTTFLRFPYFLNGILLSYRICRRERKCPLMKFRIL